MISAKVTDERRRQLRRRRGGGKEKGESAIPVSEEGERRYIELVPSDQPPVDDLVANRDKRVEFLELLRDDRLKETARLHLDGLNNTEIGARLLVERRTVAAQLTRIFRIWRTAYLLNDRVLQVPDIDAELTRLFSQLKPFASKDQ